MAPAETDRPRLQEYRLERVRTDSGTGFFSCVPKDGDSFEQHLDVLRHRPMDEFLHLHLLRAITDWDRDRLAKALSQVPDDDPVLQSLLLEAALIHDRFDHAGRRRLSAYSPLIYLRSALLSDQDLHRKWTALLAPNIFNHEPLVQQQIQSLSPPVTKKPPDPVTFQTLFGQLTGRVEPSRGDPKALEATWRLAMERLAPTGAVQGVEMRHIASLSPIALLRQWRLSVSVCHGRHRYRLEGDQTAYGRGLSLAAARAACAMEMVERISAYADVVDNRLVHLPFSEPLVRASLSELDRQGRNALDPDTLALEVPYKDQQLVWMAGTEATGAGGTPALIPAQCVFLFSNFDEPALFSALGSTGLASGNTMAGARLSALMEIVERHLDAVTPFDRRQCFTLAGGDPPVAGLLADYRARGIHLQFQDIGARFGLPCYRAFVVTANDSIVRGTGAHLDGRRAAVAAMTETPYPYPRGPASRPGLTGLPARRIERLPVLSSGSANTDLMRMETLLRANGFRIFYADLTRDDIDLPVVRAAVPGLEILADFDRYSRVHPEAFFNFIKTVNA
ncbi:MAG: YcaO-like family protein [Desulfobacterales bacterium]|nr:YcaO-like family protein [Desulfobacterales bacterium]